MIDMPKPWAEFGAICNRNPVCAKLMKLGGQDLISETNKIAGANIPDCDAREWAVMAVIALRKAGYN